MSNEHSDALVIYGVTGIPAGWVRQDTAVVFAGGAAAGTLKN